MDPGNTIWMRRRSGAALPRLVLDGASRRPVDHEHRPVVGWISPTAILATVDLPEPDSPHKRKNVFAALDRECDVRLPP